MNLIGLLIGHSINEITKLFQLFSKLDLNLDNHFF